MLLIHTVFKNKNEIRKQQQQNNQVENVSFSMIEFEIEIDFGCTIYFQVVNLCAKPFGSLCCCFRMFNVVWIFVFVRVNKMIFLSRCYNFSFRCCYLWRFTWHLSSLNSSSSINATIFVARHSIQSAFYTEWEKKILWWTRKQATIMWMKEILTENSSSHNPMKWR